MTEAPAPTTRRERAQQERAQSALDAPGRGAGRTGGGVAVAAVGVVGELLITAGVLLGLIVVWQLWWTDVVAGREQAEIVDDLGWARQPAATPSPTPTPSAEPTAGPRRDEPAPVLPEPAEGTTFATLSVPRWGADYVRPISQGTSRSRVLDPLGIGHYEGTAMPGAIGNFAVAGHRVTYNKPFNRIEEVMVGDALVVQTESTWYVYRATGAEVVAPSDVDVVAPVPGLPGETPTEAVMTLTTCHPMYSARERFVLHAALDYWMPVADGVPVELTDPVAGLAGGA